MIWDIQQSYLPKEVCLANGVESFLKNKSYDNVIHFPCLSYMTTRFCYLFINYFIMLIYILLFLTHTLLKTDLFINIILGVN